MDITFKDVYMTENIFTNISGLPEDKFASICNDQNYTFSHPLKDIKNAEGSGDQNALGDRSGGIWFDGNSGTVLDFTVCDSTISNIGFSQDPNYMIEIDGAGNGIVWDATWTNSNGVQYNTASSSSVVYDHVFAQNSNTAVKLKAYGRYSGNRSNRNLKLSISKGDTATYTFNGTSATSVYDGNPIGYPQMRIDRVGNNYYNNDFMSMFDDALLRINLSNNTLTNPNLVNSNGVSIFNNSGYTWVRTISDKRESVDGNWNYLAGFFTSLQKYVASSGEYVNVDSSSTATAETSRRLAKDAGTYRYNTSSICRAIALQLSKSDGTTWYMLLTPGDEASFTHTVTPKALDVTVDTPEISYNGNRANFVNSAESPSARARYTLTGKVGGDDVAVDPTKVGYANSVGTPINQAVNAGDYYLNITGVIGSAASNYTINVAKSFSIKPVNVRITPPSITINYGNTIMSQSAFAGYTLEFTDFQGRASDITALPNGTSLLFDVKVYANDYLFGISGNNRY
ncbi:MAG: hypothetical protein K2I79_02435, partial [Clostridia bacterium]|nr:hypothetical protein [Clostridia bacterium]